MIDLKTILIRYPNCIEKRASFKAVLTDLCPNEKRTVNILTIMLECGIVQRIKNKTVLYETEVQALLLQLDNEYGIQTEHALEGIRIWADALGVAVGSASASAAAQVVQKPIGRRRLGYSVKNAASQGTRVKGYGIGSTIEFGAYWQGADKSDGKKPIEWRVLDKQDNKVLITSEYALDCKPYNERKVGITWEKCSLRTWLNREFLRDAFSAEEQSRIIATRVSADRNPSRATDPGNPTPDKVFLLSIAEAEKYFSSDEDRKCAPTAYAKAHGAYTDEDYKTATGEATCWWWLRSPGISGDDAAHVRSVGGVSINGGGVHYGSIAVRPALWIDLKWADALGIAVGSASASAAAQVVQKPIGRRRLGYSVKNAASQGARVNGYGIGSTIEFGAYWQGADKSDGKKPIEWRVLDKQENKVLITSEYALDCKPYNERDVDITWEKCSLRNWLNREFLRDAFSAEEQSRIIATRVSADGNPWYATDPGNPTLDKVFLLSIVEAEKYFSFDEDRKCAPTAYAKAQGAYTDEDYKTANGEEICWWWLRSPGGNCNYAAFVFLGGGGVVDDGGDCVDRSYNAVRPALWIDLKWADALGVAVGSASASAAAQVVQKPIGRRRLGYSVKNAASQGTRAKGYGIGSTIEFGAYWQGADKSDGKKPIEWRVLDKQDNKVLITSEYALDCKPYNERYVDITWEKCSLRTWLNGEFLRTAFSAEEQSRIIATWVSADRNPRYATDPGNPTPDKVFLLSIVEAEKHFSSDEDRKCAPTAYAKAQGAYTSDSYKTANGEETCWCWLRSPGSLSYYAADVSCDGGVDDYGYGVRDGDCAVRPALWIDLKWADALGVAVGSASASAAAQVVQKPIGRRLGYSVKNAASQGTRAKGYGIGSTIEFGAYWQGGDKSDGKKPIEWRVLDVQGGRALLISEYALDCKPYNEKWVGITWEKCTLRSWLNNDFKNAAFTAEELSKIPTVTVKAHKNPSYSTNPGNDTQDKIFLLSITEAEQYFENDEARKVAPTAYAKGKGATTSYLKTATGDATCWWWLRSPGYDGSRAARVHDFGVLGYDGYYVDLSNGAVRPALWINLKS